MKKYEKVRLLVLDDDDMECRTKDQGIKEMSIEDTGFSMFALMPFDMVVYSGKKGNKILRSKYTKTGEIKN